MDYGFIYKDDSKFFCGSVRDSRLVFYKDLENNIIGNIYRARVEDFLKSMRAYIVDIGEKKKAILKKSQIVSDIKLGDEILVIVNFYPKDDKLIEVSEKIFISKKDVYISKFKPRKRAEDINFVDGYYFYKFNSKIGEDDKKTFSTLRDKIGGVYLERNQLPTPKLILENQFIENFIHAEELCFSNKKFDLGEKYQEDFNPKFNSLLSSELKKMTKRVIEDENFSISIDSLEALTIIDVNSKGSFIKLSKEDMSYKVNSNSLKEICLQIKLRNIKKMVIIDFIRMRESDKDLLISEFKRQAKNCDLSIKFLGFSNLGLYEIIVF